MQPTKTEKIIKQIGLQELMQICAYDVNAAKNGFMTLLSCAENVKLVDVSYRSFYEKEHIKGAYSIPIKLLAKCASYFLKEDDTVVTYGANANCSVSTDAAEILSSLGYKKIFDFKGGLEEYKKSNLPLAGSLHLNKRNPDDKNKPNIWETVLKVISRGLMDEEFHNVWMGPIVKSCKQL